MNGRRSRETTLAVLVTWGPVGVERQMAIGRVPTPDQSSGANHVRSKAAGMRDSIRTSARTLPRHRARSRARADRQSGTCAHGLLCRKPLVESFAGTLPLAI